MMQYKLSHLPLVKVILPFISGILIFSFYTFPIRPFLWVAIILLAVLLVTHLFFKKYDIKLVQTILIISLLFCIGGILSLQNNPVNHVRHFSKYNGDFAEGIISKTIEEKEKSYKTVIAISKLIDSSQKAIPVDGNLLVYIQKDSLFKTMEIGDEVLFQLKAKEVEVPKNPGQFDYQNYLKHKSIYQQQYLASHQISILEKHKSLWLKRFSNSIGIYVQSILRKYIPEKEHFALADGILLGHRADIDVELYDAFAFTGIIHILSVSGLHVGIIYGMLLFFLSFIKDRNKQIKIAKFIFISLFIWMFTFVTGFSAACVRAAILFTLLNYGKLNKENVSNLNILAGAALLQLLIDPQNIFDIGFQLSYLAMLGLFIFTKPIYTLFYFPNKLADWTWKLWSASIAAQLFTVPLAIYYFGNFPTYFLFANIFAIPLSTVILWLGIFIIPFSFIPNVALLIGWLESKVIGLFIKLTYLFSGLPLGKMNNLYISKIQLIILFIAVLLFAFYVIQRKGLYIISGLMLFLTTICISYAYSIQHINQNNIVLYSTQKNFIAAVNKQNHQIIISKDTIIEKTFSFSIKNSHRIYRINDFKSFLLGDSLNSMNILKSDNLIFLNQKSFYFLTGENTRKVFSPPLAVDYLVLSDNCFLNIESVKANYSYKQLLISSDNDNYHLTIFRKLLKENKIDFVDLSETSLVIN